VQAALQELAAARKAHARQKKAAVDDLSDLSKIDQQIAKFRKQNAEMRAQLDQTNRVDDVNGLRSEIAGVQQQLEAQELENETLQKILERQRQGIVQQGPTEVQQKEATRLKQQVRALQKQLREDGKVSLQGGRQQQQHHLEFAKLCERRSRLKRSLDEGEVALTRINSTAAPAEVLLRVEESEKALKAAKQQRKLQKKKFDVRVHDVKAELEKLRGSLERHTASILRKREAIVEACEALGLEPPASVDADEAELLAEISRARDEEARRERMQAQAQVEADRAARMSPTLQAKMNAAERRRQSKRAATLVQAVQRGRVGRAAAAARKEEYLAELEKNKKSAVNPFARGGGGFGGKKKGFLAGGISAANAQPATATVSPTAPNKARVANTSPFALKPVSQKPKMVSDPPASWRSPSKQSPDPAPLAPEPSLVLGAEPTGTAVAADSTPFAVAPPAATAQKPKVGRGRRMLEEDDEKSVLSRGAAYTPLSLAPVVPPPGAQRRPPFGPQVAPSMEPPPAEGRPAGMGFGVGTISSALASAREEMAAGGSQRDKPIGFVSGGSVGGALAAARKELAGGAGAIGGGAKPLGIGRRAVGGGALLSKPVIGAPTATGRRNDLDLDFGTGPTRQPVADPFANVQPKALLSQPAALALSDPFTRKPLGSMPGDSISGGQAHPTLAGRDIVSTPLPSKPKPKLLSPSKLMAPSFTDEIDDDALMAEEQAFLARMKGGEGSTIVESDPPKPALQETSEPRVAETPPAPVQARDSFMDDVADVSDEELL
jgi:hypothetical protein